MMDTKNGNVRRLTRGDAEVDPAWAPDGTAIAYGHCFNIASPNAVHARPVRPGRGKRCLPPAHAHTLRLRGWVLMVARQHTDRVHTVDSAC